MLGDLNKGPLKDDPALHPTLEALFPPEPAGLVRTEGVMQFAEHFDMTRSQSPEGVGRVVAALAADEYLMSTTAAPSSSMISPPGTGSTSPPDPWRTGVDAP